jgi:hypothetical protein
MAANHNREEFSADDLIRLFRSRRELHGMTTEELHGRLLAWRPPIARGAIERVMARAIYNQEEGTENMVCPPAWREAFEAADELRERYLAIPTETLAEIFVAAHDLQAGDLGDDDVAAATERLAELSERWGITRELQDQAVGPDSEEIPKEERGRRIREVLAEVYYGEKGYYIQQHITRIVNDRRDR